MKKKGVIIFLLLSIIIIAGCEKRLEKPVQNLEAEQQGLLCVNGSTGEFSLTLFPSTEDMYDVAKLSTDKLKLLLGRIPKDLSLDYEVYDLTSNRMEKLSIDTDVILRNTDGVVVGGLEHMIEWLSPDCIVIPVFNIIYNIETSFAYNCVLPNKGRFNGYFIDELENQYYVFHTAWDYKDKPDVYLSSFNSNGTLLDTITLPIKVYMPIVIGELRDEQLAVSYYPDGYDIHICYYDLSTGEMIKWQEPLLTHALNTESKQIAVIPYKKTPEILAGNEEDEYIIIYNNQGKKMSSYDLPGSYSTAFAPEGIFWSNDCQELYVVFSEELESKTHVFKIDMLNERATAELVLTVPFLCYVAGIDGDNNIYMLANRPSLAVLESSSN